MQANFTTLYGQMGSKIVIEVLGTMSYFGVTNVRTSISQPLQLLALNMDTHGDFLIMFILVSTPLS